MKICRLCLCLAVSVGVGLGAACTFPDVSFAPEGATDDGGAGDSGGLNAADALPKASEEDSGPVDPDGVKEDAATRDGGVVRPEAGADGAAGCGGLAGDACDCDGDKYGNQSCPAKDGGFDCDDFDNLVHPDAGFVAAQWDTKSPHTPAGDWDCDGVVTKQYPYKVSCGLLQDCKAQGFTGDPKCGETSDYIFCKPGLLGAIYCQDGPSEKRTQGCR